MRTYDSASRSLAALLAEYGEVGCTGWVSGHEPVSIDPYTSSVDTCRNRPTWCRSAASSRVWVPSTLVTTKSAAPTIDRSTWDSAAKWTTQSTPRITSSIRAASQMSPLTNRSRSDSLTGARLSGFPA